MDEGRGILSFLGGRGGAYIFFSTRHNLSTPRKNSLATWKGKSIQSNRSKLVFITAENFLFTQPSVFGFLYTSMKRRKRDSRGLKRILACIDEIHAGIKLHHLYNHNLASFSLVNCCQMIWKLAVTGHVWVLSLCFRGWGNALALHACQVRTLSTLWALDSHALSHALSVVAITWLILQEKGRTDWFKHSTYIGK